MALRRAMCDLVNSDDDMLSGAALGGLRAAIACEMVELFVNVTGVPAFARTREGLRP